MSQARRILIPMEDEAAGHALAALQPQARPLDAPRINTISPRTPLPPAALLQISNETVHAAQPDEGIPNSSASLIQQQPSSISSSSGFGHFTSSAMRSRSGKEIPVIEIPSSSAPREEERSIARNNTAVGEDDDEEDEEDRIQIPQRKRSNARSRSGPMPILDIDEDDLVVPGPSKTVAEKESSRGNSRREAEADAEVEPEPEPIVYHVISESDDDYEEAGARKKAQAKKRKKAPTKAAEKAQQAKKKKAEQQAEAAQEEEGRPKADTTRKGSGSGAKRGRKPKAQAVPEKAPEPVPEAEPEPQPEPVPASEERAAENIQEAAVAPGAEAEVQARDEDEVAPPTRNEAPVRPPETAATKKVDPKVPSKPLSERRNNTEKAPSESTSREQTDNKSSSFWGKPLSRILGAGATRRPGLSRRIQIPTLHANRKSPPPPKPKLPPPKKVKKTRSEWSDDGSAAEEEAQRKRELGEDDDDDEGGDLEGPMGEASRLDDGGDVRPGFEEEIEAY
ncbi:hypothetical protein A4X13_0g1474 [Tilletia indica]|uniref:Uncharacterized protein n=1 Tax=Tilletia indica TaxID=43049 RepID=A0A177TH05_9BASI|nr:hypothetical protein A4X13_0g1474 [Tilletia indica]